MSKFAKLLKEKENNLQIEDTFNNIEGIEEVIKLISFDDIISNTDNPYPLSDLEDMIQSIKMFGLEQNLVVKDCGNGKYEIISGHRRYSAIESILENDTENKFLELESLYCKVIDKDIDELSLRIRLHETNITSRSLLSMSDDEKKEIVSDYMELLELAREKNLIINGIPVAGKTRDLVAKHFNISSSSAQRIMKSIKEDDLDIENEKEQAPEIPPAIKQVQDIEGKIKALGKSFEKAIDVSVEERNRLISTTLELLDELKI